MKNTVLIVGEKFRYADDFLEYFKRKIGEKMTKIDSFLFIKENDPNILIELENYIEKSSNILIAASRSNFALIGKMLSTHLLDTLVVRGDMLIPSKCKKHEIGSYVVTIKGKPVNAIRIDTTEEIPPILLEDKLKLKKMFILEDDEEHVKLLMSPITQTSDILISICKTHSGYIEIVAEEKKYGKLENLFASITKLFGQKAIIADSLEEYLIDEMRSKGQKIAVVESCSGGLLSYKFTRIPGCSDVFFGSLTTYANEAKCLWLGIDENIIAEHGAVSEESVSAMLEGALTISRADYVAAISGIAGPGGGSDDKPVGTVYVGVASSNGVVNIEKKNFKGDRNLIQSSAAGYALKMLCEIFQ